MAEPVFLVAARRSGTTLLRVMLGGHPEVVFHRGWEAVAGTLADPASWNSRKTFCFNGISSFEAASAAEFSSRINERVDAALSDAGGRVFAAACHVGFLELQKAFPDARYIHMVRDPRDVAISHLTLGWDGHPYFASQGWKQAETDWDRLRREVPADRVTELRYEDLVADPRRELGALCEFLGIPWSEAVFDYTETTSYSYPKKSLSERWRRRLGPREVTQIESRIRPLMPDRGYVPEGEARTYGQAATAWFGVQGYVRERLVRIRKEGLGFLIVSKLVRMSGSHRLSERHARHVRDRRRRQIEKLEKNY